LPGDAAAESAGSAPSGGRASRRSTTALPASRPSATGQGVVYGRPAPAAPVELLGRALVPLDESAQRASTPLQGHRWNGSDTDLPPSATAQTDAGIAGLMRGGRASSAARSASSMRQRPTSRQSWTRHAVEAGAGNEFEAASPASGSH
jgi:hypothetical protein